MVSSLDHVVVQGTDPAGVFGLFVETLGLPAQGPLTRREGSTTREFLADNVVVEAISPNSVLPPTAATGAPRARLLSAAFGSNLPIWRFPTEVRQRGFLPLPASVHRGPIPSAYRPYTDPDLLMADRPLIAASFTVHGVVQPVVQRINSAVQIFGYTHDVDRRHADERAAFRKHGGGPLGVLGVREVWAETGSDWQGGLDRWRRFFAPAPAAAPGIWCVGAGPALRVCPGSADRWRGLLLQVASVERAAAHLAARGIACSVIGGLAQIDPAATFDLGIFLTDGQPDQPVAETLFAATVANRPLNAATRSGAGPFPPVPAAD